MRRLEYEPQSRGEETNRVRVGIAALFPGGRARYHHDVGFYTAVNTAAELMTAAWAGDEFPSPEELRRLADELRAAAGPIVVPPDLGVG